jgi:hypothetical protein
MKLKRGYLKLYAVCIGFLILILAWSAGVTGEMSIGLLLVKGVILIASIPIGTLIGTGAAYFLRSDPPDDIEGPYLMMITLPFGLLISIGLAVFIIMNF